MLQEAIENVVPSGSRAPYYIFAPPYERRSAGIRSLHLLCHWLNRKGYPAFVHILSDPKRPQAHPDLVTPVLSQRLVQQHHKAGKTPIVVYPEIVSGNPLEAACVVRYVLNYPGLLGGDREFARDELLFAYSERLARGVSQECSVLFLPVIDRTIFWGGDTGQREGACYYAAKYKSAGYATFGLPPNAIEIVRDGPNAQPPVEIARLFRTAETFYCFEDSALILEAALCGCPTVIMKSAFFRHPLGLAEFGYDGLAVDTSSEQLRRAQQTVGNVQETYSKLCERFWGELDNFVELTQAKAAALPVQRKLTFEPMRKGQLVRKDDFKRIFLHAAEQGTFGTACLELLKAFRRTTSVVRFKAKKLGSAGYLSQPDYYAMLRKNNIAPIKKFFSVLRDFRVVRIFKDQLV